MCGKSNMETYITICKIDNQREFAIWLRKFKQGFCINLEGWDGEADGREVQKGAGICIPMADSCRGLTSEPEKLLSLAQLFVTPQTIAYQAHPSMEFSRQEHWSGLPFPSPGDLPNPGIEPRSPALQADALPSEPPGKPRKQQNSVKQVSLS